VKEAIISIIRVIRVIRGQQRFSMTTQYPKRLIEVDLPIKRISAHARREKSIRHGHISTLHIWWARRPLAACRAAVYGALLQPSAFLRENQYDAKKNTVERGNPQAHYSDPAQSTHCLGVIASVRGWRMTPKTCQWNDADHTADPNSLYAVLDPLDNPHVKPAGIQEPAERLGPARRKARGTQCVSARRGQK